MWTPTRIPNQSEVGTLVRPNSWPPHITPLVVVYERGGTKVYAKMENYQVTWSVKYRVAWNLIRAAEKSGELRKGMRIIEESSGNTGIALAYLGKHLGYPVTIIVSKDGCTKEAQGMMRIEGAEVVPLDGWIRERQACIQNRLSEDSRYYWTCQGSNPVNRQSSLNLGKEILEQLPHVDVFLACTGTCATITGVGSALKERQQDTRVIGVVPATEFDFPGVDDYRTYDTPLLTDELKRELLDEPFVIENSSHVRDAMKRLHDEKRFVGFSSAAAYYAATQLAHRLKKGNIVIIFPDNGDRYHSMVR